MDYGILSIIPIVLVLILVFATKNAFISIAFGILTGSIIILAKEGEFLVGTTELVKVFSNGDTVMIIFFVMLIGALVYAMEASGGTEALSIYFSKKKRNAKSKIGIQLFTMLTGLVMFVDASSSMAMTSVVGGPLFSQAKIPKEKLALIANSTGAPIAWIIPFGGAGAMTAGILSQIEGIEGNSFSYVLQAVPFQFYTLALLLLLLVSIIFNFEIGGLRKISSKEYTETIVTFNTDIPASKKPKIANMIIPICILITSIFTLLLVTGKGNLFNGAGALSIFVSGLISLVLTMVLYMVQRITTLDKCLGWFFHGMKNMLEVTVLLIIAFTFSGIITRLQTASYILQVISGVHIGLMPFFAVIICAVIAFATGTSSGTVALATPIILPIIIMSGGNIPLVIGAIISGAVFGDQCSPISDSVILTSSLTGVNAITHVKTQLPYTIIALAMSVVMYLILGFII